MTTVLLTGVAGFIGFHVAARLLEHGYRVVGLDTIDSYYDVEIKLGRLEQLGIDRSLIDENEKIGSTKSPDFHFVKSDICDRTYLDALMGEEKFQKVCHLAAQAGVRYSLKDPHKYVQSNLVGFMNILEACRHHAVEHLVYASSSSVYGLNEKVPFSVEEPVDHPISIYAATKKSNELMAHCYSYLYGLPTTGLRFFTVYGPWGRPDMALFLFTRAILNDEPIDVYNNGNMVRDFTYIDDIVEGVQRIMERIPQPSESWDAKAPKPNISPSPFKLYNIGNNRPVNLMDFIRALEKELDRKARIRFLPLQPGDVPMTMADVSDLEKEIGFRPRTPVEVGISSFVRWYRQYYGV